MVAGSLCQDVRDPISSLSENIPGSPGEDYPIFSFPPETSFQCDGHIEGYYADTEAECQAFHICGNLGDTSLVKYDFLCPNGTLFNQQYFICDWWFNVDCSLVNISILCIEVLILVIILYRQRHSTVLMKMLLQLPLLTVEIMDLAVKTKINSIYLQ